ncbi:helix-turn-helix domain-containing protein [Paenibacillus daejeonensis]|uniref:helix-turn-helix domain-containing protein n=1 Tax=Paenibacillus daejeonensis TaxID=135193 RepID=UPI00036D1109|nr:helix-turn-helix domain-containing protein [Paenibacillus daejeonensis]
MNEKWSEAGLLLHELFKLPVHLVTKEGKVVSRIGQSLGHSMQTDLALFFTTPMPPERSDTRVSTRTTAAGERLLLIPLPGSTADASWLAIGPFLSDSVASDDQSLIVLGNEQQLLVARTGYFMLHGTLIEEHAIRLDEQAVSTPAYIQESQKRINDRKLRQELHHDWQDERQLLRCISEGNPDKLAAMLKGPDFISNPGVLSRKSQLQNQKNLTITVVTLATRYAMEGGLPSETAYHLSDLYIQKLDELHRFSDVDALLKRALIDFAEQVRNAHWSHCSMPVRRAVHYVQNHVYDKFDLEQAARVSGYTADYLARRFKLETGRSFHDYVAELRIREAQNLILYSTLALSEISSLLHFCDQSYFTKVFKKYTGQTPKQYQKGLATSPP